MWVDSDHAGNRLIRRSRTGVIIFVNKAPILWYSKGQNTVESSTFGSEFVAMRQAVDMNDSIRYKLRMFGISITGATNVFADNMSVITNSTVPSSTISKKHFTICYHRVRESVAAGVIHIAWVHSSKNLADLLTKPLPAPTRHFLLGQILY